jgi:rhamnosyltransferase
MFKVIVPTLNAAKDWPMFARSLLGSVVPDQVLIIDSESTDDTVSLAARAGFQVCSTPRSEFNHGGTRQRTVEMFPDAEILVFLTQDAVLEGDGALASLLTPFTDRTVGAAYGRQLPRPGARAIEAHARSFNYSAHSEIRTLASRTRLGIRAAFLSNSLAAYRRSVLVEVGGFPTNVIFGEDTVTAARMLLAGYKVAYVAEARAYHSHPYSPAQEFRRYFDIGVLHSREGWLLKEFGRVGGEGKRFVISELRYLLRHEPWSVPSAFLRTLTKLLGYRLGLMESKMTIEIKRRLSMHPKFWKNSEHSRP